MATDASGAGGDPASAGADPAAAAGGGAPQPWAGLSEANRGYIQTKGFKNEDSLATAYRELEGFRGVPAERLLKLPEKPDAPEWADVHKRLGRPDKPEEYGIEGADAALLAEAHAAGLSKAQVERLAKHLSERGKGAAEKAKNERAAQAQLEEQTLKREWGQEYDANVRNAREVAKRAYQALGYKDVGELNEVLGTIEDQLGHSRFMKFFAFLGKGTAPHGFVEGEGDGNGFGDTTPAAAMAKFKQLSSSAEFMGRIASGDLAAKAEWDRWAKLAEPSFRGGGPQA